MPPKQKKNNTNTNQEEEESFQAVILTDSFEEQFLPLSHELPRVKKKKAVKKLVSYLHRPISALCLSVTSQSSSIH